MRTLIGFMFRVFSGLRFRLLVMVLLVCAPLVALFLHTAGEDRRRAMSGWQQRSQRLMQVARREEQEVIGGTRQLLLAVSESSSVRGLNSRRCKKWLDELFTSYPRYSNLGVLTTNGTLVASAMPISEDDDFTEHQFFRKALDTKAFAIGRLAEVPDGPRPTLKFGYPVLDRNGTAIAVVFAELDLEWFARFASELPNQMPRAATWTEINRTGTILGRYPKPEDWLGRGFKPELVEAVFNGPNGTGEDAGLNGVPNFYAFGTMHSRLAGGKVAAVLSIPRPNLFAEADRVLKRNLTWLAAAAGLAVLVGWLAGRLLILRPVKALLRSSLRLAAGELVTRTGVIHSRDELGQLTLAFDQMAQALEQRELERQRASHKLQVLSHRLVEVQETERRHIARELHDEIGQNLTAAEMNLQAALRLPGAAALERRLEDSIRSVERVLEQVHDLSLSLRPSMLDDLGLEPALRWFSHRQAALTGMQVEFRADPLEERLDSMIETECFRVAQEALTNVVRHAQARSVKVDLSRRNGHIHLSVRDDGVGFDVGALRGEAVLGASLGLLSMEERTALAGGGLELNSTPGEGTEVHAWFPVRWRETVTVFEADEQ